MKIFTLQDFNAKYPQKLFVVCIITVLICLGLNSKENIQFSSPQALNLLKWNNKSHWNVETDTQMNEGVEDLNSTQYPYKFHLCNCIRYGKFNPENLSSLPQSTCSDFSTQRGDGQRVVSFSYFSKTKQTRRGSSHALRYLDSLKERAADAEVLYHDWIVRIYTDVKRSNKYATKVLCDVYCNNIYVDLCDVSNLPIIGNMYEKRNGMFWRFLVLGDPTIDVFLVRDSDSVIQSRELDAVSEWLESNKTFHVIRDHPAHYAPLLGGLWGAKNKKKNELKKLREKIFSREDKHKYGYDQQTLKLYVWPLAKKDILQHDSFRCIEHPGSTPFPTRRTNNVYVGWGPYGKYWPLKIFQRKECPLQCRKEPEWTKC